MAVLRSRVSDETRSAWQALAARAGITESELLRQAVTAVLAGNQPAADEAKAPDNEGESEDDSGPSIRLRLRKHESDAAADAARKLGWRRNTWIVSVIRSALFREPRPTDPELAALWKSTAELRAIGRNLNQLAHAVHRDPRYVESVTASKLDQLRHHVAAHTDAMKAMLEAIENRWTPPESFRPETLKADATPGSEG